MEDGFLKPHYRRVDAGIAREVVYITYAHTGISFSQIRSRSRRRMVVEARQIVCMALFWNTNFRLSEIGQLIGRRHATVISALKCCNTLFVNDKTYHGRHVDICRRLFIDPSRPLCNRQLFRSK